MNEELVKLFHKMTKESNLLLIDGAKDFAMYKGIAMRDSSQSKDARVHLPFCLIPTEFPREWFEYVYNLQKSINLVLYKVAHSKELLKECLLGTIEADEFTRNIFNIFEAVIDSDSMQMSLGVIRSDYLLNCDHTGKINGIKQVENNTMAVGFGGISPMLKDLYRHVLEKLKWKHYYNLPDNKSCEGIAKGMVAAWCIYGKQNAVFLFVVEEATYNIYDQRLLEYKILEYDKNIEVLRCTFKDLRTCLKKKNKKLYVYEKEVAVVYFRVGYVPEHYEPEDWKIRLLIEQSAAIKCPSVGLHLAGTKKVQLFLSQRGILEKFIDAKTAEKLREVFAYQYSLEEENESIISKAVNYPDAFVLKPEREGGGNNLYGLDIKKFLLGEEPAKKNSYILMERINPPASPNCIIRSNRVPETCLVHSEVGIYGVILGNKDQLYRNETVGHLLRSKPIKANEGGVSSGNGAVDYPFLV